MHSIIFASSTLPAATGSASDGSRGREARRAGYRTSLGLSAALAGLLILPFAGPARAQGWFTPNQPAAPKAAPVAAPAPRPAAPRAAQRQAPPQQQMMPMQGGGGPQDDGTQQADAGPQPVLPQPPVPDLPPLAKGTPPPVASIGVLGVPEIMQDSTAARQVQKEIGARREKLNADAQKEQATWRDMQQALQADHAKLTPDQGHARERELQERITNAQKQFRDRNRIIQEAAQVGLGQIERTLIGVIRQVSESRGMNLVLHRNQVALNVNEFDISKAVVEQLNKVLPSVLIPADGVDPAAMAAAQASNAPPGSGNVSMPLAAPEPAAAGATPAASSPAAPAPAAASAPAAPAAKR